ncbi:MAG TPA: hypothetical protein VM142_10960 [Acidimicrobiales bacterium]|nr:hypothetical protein [Acidimicrobiales bacterium]
MPNAGHYQVWSERKEVFDDVVPRHLLAEAHPIWSHPGRWGATHEAWDGLDGRIDGLRRELVSGEEMDDWQDVGRRAREIVIDLANLVYRPEMTSSDEPAPQRSNAKAKMDGYLNPKVPGPQNAELRAAVRSA